MNLFCVLPLAILPQGGPYGDTFLRVCGSDTMVNLAQAWADEYSRTTGVNVEVAGGGSGVGIADLIRGDCDMANCSRKIKAPEIQLAKDKLGKMAVQMGFLPVKPGKSKTKTK